MTLPLAELEVCTLWNHWDLCDRCLTSIFLNTQDVSSAVCSISRSLWCKLLAILKVLCSLQCGHCISRFLKGFRLQALEALDDTFLWRSEFPEGTAHFHPTLSLPRCCLALKDGLEMLSAFSCSPALTLASASHMSILTRSVKDTSINFLLSTTHSSFWLKLYKIA